LIAMVLSVFTGCDGADHPIDHPRQPGTVLITFHEGRNWLSYLTFFRVFKRAKPPQIALWLEEPDGTFVVTLYVTRRTAAQDWRPMPSENKGEIRRPSALPIWTYTHVRGGIQPIESCSACHDRHRSAVKSTEGDPFLDSITGATPETGFEREWKIPPELKTGTYILCAEINHSFDYNDTYRKDLPAEDPLENGVNGQPSLFLAGPIALGKTASRVVLRPLGHGHPAGNDGRVYEGLEGMTTALSIVRTIEADYHP